MENVAGEVPVGYAAEERVPLALHSYPDGTAMRKATRAAAAPEHRVSGTWTLFPYARSPVSGQFGKFTHPSAHCFRSLPQNYGYFTTKTG